jgi:hypothetical protein
MVVYYNVQLTLNKYIWKFMNILTNYEGLH